MDTQPTNPDPAKPYAASTPDSSTPQTQPPDTHPPSVHPNPAQPPSRLLPPHSPTWTPPPGYQHDRFEDEDEDDDYIDEDEEDRPAPPPPPPPPRPRKHRPESKLKRLPEPLQEEIYRFSIDHSLAETVEFIATAGTRTSIAAVSRFLSSYRLKQQLERQDAVIFSLLQEQANPDFTPEKAAELGLTFFSALALEHQDARAWCHLQQIAIQRGKLALAREKFVNYEKIKELKKFPPEERALSAKTLRWVEKQLNLF